MQLYKNISLFVVLILQWKVNAVDITSLFSVLSIISSFLYIIFIFSLCYLAQLSNISSHVDLRLNKMLFV